MLKWAYQNDAQSKHHAYVRTHFPPEAHFPGPATHSYHAWQQEYADSVHD